MKSLYQQIQDLRYMPHARSHKSPGFRDGAEQRAAEWKQLTNELRALHVRLAYLELTQSQDDVINDVARDAAAVEHKRNELKKQYWRQECGQGVA